MADVKISALPSATTPLAGTELVPVVQAGITTQTTVTDIVAKAPVQSVAGKTGAVTLTPSDVGAEPADATILKSASIGVTVQGYNANTVVDAAYVHTDNNYTTAEKSKLAGIAAGAEVNVNADWNAVSGDAQILNKPSFATVATTGAYADLTGKPTLGTAAATASTDYATAAQGTLADSAVQPAAIANMLETADIGVTVQGYSSVLTNTTASFTTADETKLDGIAAGAEVNVNADWTAVSGDAQILNKPSFATVATTGAYADLTGKPTLGTAAATASTDYATAAQGALADSAVQPVAIANMLETSDIGVTVQGYSSVLANTTASFTTADEAKLDGIQAGAEVNVNADWTAVSGDAQILNKPTLGTAAAANTTDFATAAQGTKADSALQPAAIGVSVQAYDADLTSWAAITPSTKQNTLVSGTNIKTINSTSLLGSGNLDVQPTLVSGTNIKTINGSSLLGAGNLTISGGGGSLAVSNEGTSITSGATSLNFVGAGVTATASGTDVTVTVPGGGGGGGASFEVGEVMLASDTPTSGTWLETGKYYSKAAYPDLATKLGSVADFGNFATVPQAQLPQPFATSTTNGFSYICATDGTASVVVGTGGAIRKTTDGLNWQGVPSTTTQQLNEVRYINSKFVAVGNSGTIVYSANGTDWVNTSTTNTFQFTSVAYGAGVYVVVGQLGAIYSSSDLIVWSNRSQVTAQQFGRVIFANGIFVAVGSGGICYTSPDGITWTSRSAGASTLFDVIYANGLFVAVGVTNSVYTSPDGATWTLQTAAGSFVSIVYANSLFVIGGGGGAIFTSPDAVTWTSRTSGLPAVTGVPSIAWNGTNFVAVSGGSATGGGAYATSPDGVTWTAYRDVSVANFICVAVANGKTIAFGSTSSVILAGATRQEVLQSGTWAYTVAAQSASNPRTIAYNGTDLYVAAGSNGTILTSPDGQAWTGRFTGLTTNFDKVAYLNGNWIVMGGSGSGTNLLTSPDGITWTARTADTAIFNGAAYGAGVYVVVGASGAVFSSPDLVTWTSRSAGANRFTDVIFANGVFVAVGDSNSVYSSSDGITWTLRTATGGFTRIIYANSLFVAVGGAVIVTSPDGITWTSRTSNSSRALVHIAWNGSLFVCAGGGGGTPSTNIVTSPDGITWTLAYSVTGATVPSGVAWNGTYFVVSNISDGSVLVSSNGVNWAKYGSAFDGGSTYTEYLGTKFVSVGPQQIQTSTDGLSWTNADHVQYVPTALNRTYKLGNKYYALSTTVGIYQSDDGITWSAARTAPRRPFIGMAYNGTFWLALIGASTNKPASVYKSTDGTTWTRAADFGTVAATTTGPTAFIDIEYANGNFIIGCPVTAGQNIVYTIYTSADGVTWTGRLTPFLLAPTGAIASNGTTAVFNGGSGSFKSSDGGISWQSITNTLSTSVIYSNNLWLFTGATAFLTSSDLQNFIYTGNSSATHQTSQVYVGSKLVIGFSSSNGVGKILIGKNSTGYSLGVSSTISTPSITAISKSIPIRENTALIANSASNNISPNLLSEAPLYSYDTATTFFVPPSNAGGGQTAYIYAGA